jgi:hypothetical protein
MVAGENPQRFDMKTDDFLNLDIEVQVCENQTIPA